MRIPLSLVVLGLLASPAAYGVGLITLVTSTAALGQNDSVVWSLLGPDGTTIPNTFSGSSTHGDAISGVFQFSGTATGSVATVGTSWGPASGAFTNGDVLIWGLNGNTGSGPVAITFPTGFGAGAAIQADTPGQFTAQIQLFAGATLLGTESLASDSNGDAIFIGALDTVAEVTSASFSLTAAQANSNTTNNLGDFALDTLYLQNPASASPEPGSWILIAGVASLGLSRRVRTTALAAARRS